MWRKCIIYFEIHTNEYSSIIQMSAAAESCKFYTDMVEQEDRVKGVKRRSKKRKRNYKHES